MHYILKQYIDTEKLLLNLDSVLNAIKHKTKLSFCDREIKKLDEKIKVYYENINNNLDNINFKQISSKQISYKRSSRNIEYCEKVYMYENMYLFGIEASGYYCGCTLLGYINTHTDDFLFVCDVGSHPWIFSNKFTYANSDGSGPTFSSFKDFSVDVIINEIKKYYLEFCDNRYH